MSDPLLPPPEDDPSRSPALLAPLPRRGPGVRRLNKVPVLIFIGGICLVVSAIGYTYKVRLASSAAAVTEGNAKPQSANGAAVLNGAPMAGEIQSAVFRPAILPPKLPPQGAFPAAPAQAQMGQPRDASGQQQGQDDDPAVLDRALDGAESLFWVVPPSFQAPDVQKRFLDFTRPAVVAIRKHGIKRVVAVSSLGRGLGRKAGVISASHAMDDLLEASGAAFRGLWCPGFMDNMLGQVESLKKTGTFFLPLKPDLKIPHASTGDISTSAAKLLLDKSWTGNGGLAVLGPEDLSFDQIAVILSETLGKPIRYQQIPGETYKQTLMHYGGSEAMADGLNEMYGAINEGLYNAETRNAENTTKTSFRVWAETYLKPAFLA